jgi:hypothetical protein
MRGSTFHLLLGSITAEYQPLIDYEIMNRICYSGSYALPYTCNPTLIMLSRYLLVCVALARMYILLLILSCLFDLLCNLQIVEYPAIIGHILRVTSRWKSSPHLLHIRCAGFSTQRKGKRSSFQETSTSSTSRCSMLFMIEA